MTVDADTQGTGHAPRRFCVYTTLVGGYETLNEQPAAAGSRVPFVCLTDDGNLRSDTWQVRRVEPLFGKDTVRSQRAHKLLPHDHLPDFDASLYIDNTVILKDSADRLIEQLDVAAGLCLPTHSFRETVLDEFVAVAKSGRDDLDRIFEQLEHCAAEFPNLLAAKPFWTGLLLRDHRNVRVRAMSEIWFAAVARYSRRDQLSFNFALHRAGVRPQVLTLDNFRSAFHSWPHPRDRDQTIGTVATRSAQHAMSGLIRELASELYCAQRALAKERRQSKGFRWSTLWRAPKPPPPATRDTGLPAAIKRLPLRFLVDPSDDRGRLLISSEGDCNPRTLTVWRLLVASEPWTHVVDVGANYGEMLFNVILPPNAQVIAYEPNPVIAAYLEMNLMAAGIDAEVHRYAVGNKAGTAELLIDRRWSGNSRLSIAPRRADNDDLQALPVPVTTLEEAWGGKSLQRGVRALVKIDVEGAEIAVLEAVIPFSMCSLILPPWSRFCTSIQPRARGWWIISRSSCSRMTPKLCGRWRRVRLRA